MAPYNKSQEKWFLYPLRNFIDLNQIIQVAGNLPVVFINDCKGPSLYEFYTGKESYSLNSLYDRKNQYNYILRESYFWDKKVVLFEKIGSKSFLDKKSIGTTTAGKIKYNYYVYDNFYSFSFIHLIPENKYLNSLGNKEIKIKCRIDNLYKKQIDSAALQRARIVYTISDTDLKYTDINLYEAMQEKDIFVKVKMPEKKGQYILKIGIIYPGLPPTHNSLPIVVNVI